MEVAFYCVADSRHFPGLVGLLNSLRLAGHREPIRVLDCGLEPGQQQRLGLHATVVPAPALRSPYLAKWAGPLVHPADVMVLVDADVIVTRSLRPLIEHASAGSVVAFSDRVDRFHPEWSALVGGGPVRRRTYVNAGLLSLPRDPGVELLEQVRGCQERVDLSRSKKLGGGTPDYPFYQPDQDVWNAVFAARPDEDALVVLEHRLAPFPPFAGLRLVSETALRCVYQDGVEPFLLHHVTEKPWLEPTRWSLYSQLLRRLLLGRDVALRLSPEEVPLRFRPHPLSAADRLRAEAVALVRAQRGRLGVRRRLEGWISGGDG